jgi:hypothetical protein
MRCLSCNKVLSNNEATRKHKETGEYLDLCNSCLKYVIEIQPIPYVSNPLNFTKEEDEETLAE